MNVVNVYYIITAMSNSVINSFGHDRLIMCHCTLEMKTMILTTLMTGWTDAAAAVNWCSDAFTTRSCSASEHVPWERLPNVLQPTYVFSKRVDLFPNLVGSSPCSSLSPSPLPFPFPTPFLFYPLLLQLPFVPRLSTYKNQLCGLRERCKLLVSEVWERAPAANAFWHFNAS